jgi:hypothetical protein
MNAIFIIFAIIYVAGIVAISLKLRDIIKNKNKYMEPEVAELARKRRREKKYLRFFQSLSHQYIVSLLPILLLSIFGITGLLKVFYKIIAGENTLILADTWLAGACGMMFIMIPVIIAVIPLHIKTPFFAVVAEGGSKDGTRYAAWKEGFIMLLITFVIGFPFYGFAANNYIYYDDEGITSSAYFQLGETYTAYEDVTKVKISVYYDDGVIDSLSYRVTLSDGRTLEMSDSTKLFFPETTVELHRNIEKYSNAEFEIEAPTEEDYANLSERLSEDKLENIKYVFEGDHQ